jgi:uncharacterized glyoxalase superfamily protein PhnB
MPRLLSAHPTLRARDIKALAEWYRDTLGFEIRLLWEDPVTFSIVERDLARFGIAQRDAAFGPVAVYAIVEDVDGLYAEFLARRVTINRPLEITNYEMKDFDLTDPEGNRICFGQGVESE